MQGPKDPAVEAQLAVRRIDTVDDLRLAAGLLRDAGEQLDTPLVDEAEQERLDAAVRDGRLPTGSWRGWLAERDKAAVGYAAIGPSGRGDLAAVPGRGRHEVLSALAEAVAEVGGDLEVWVRRAHERDIEAVEGAGWEVRRRLGVLGRSVGDDLPSADVPEGGTIRSSVAEEDDEAVVAVLAAAYAGTPDGGWSLDRFLDKRAMDWFDPADLLLAEEDGEAVALHWTKRRGGGVGEVYNLAVAPRGQGRGWGRALLVAGLAHLRDRGCDEVVLWVDRANDRAVALYESHGFATRWDDVAFS